MEIVGQILKKNREIKNLELKNISRELNISQEILSNFENNYFQDNIDPIFILGHLRSYCLYLDLNHKELVDQFKKEHFPEKSTKFEINRPTIEKNFLFSNKVFSLTLIIFIFSAFYLLFIANDKSLRDYVITPDLPEEYITVVEKASIDILKKNNTNTKEIENDLSVSSVMASSSKIQSNDSALITLKILDPTWVQLRDTNNEIIFSQLMNKNDEYSYNSKLNYSITSGNAGHILVLINQNVRGKIGKKGQVVDSLVLDKNFSN